jgi:LacI family transcriptional regulator
VVTRADVASMAGVSPAVVSYVINGGPRPVSTETRARVVASIEALRYRPHAVASALRRGSARAVGLMMPSPVDPYFAELADAVESALYEVGYLFSLGIAHPEDPVRDQDQLLSLVGRRMDGLILSSTDAVTRLKAAGEDTPPIVVLDGAVGGLSVSKVGVDNVGDAAYAVAHLQDWGHRVIGCISGPAPVPMCSERVEGWRRQQDEVGAPHGPRLLCRAELSARGGALAAQAMLGGDGGLAEASRPTAVFVTSDVQAHGVLQVCHALGLAVPADISIVSFDGTQSTRYTQPPLTSMRQPIKELGATAVRVLLQMIAEPARVSNLLLHSNLVLGGSCAEVRSGR